MPTRDPVSLADEKLSLRLIGPRALVWPESLAADVAVLARSDMVARPLRCSQLPTSPDLASGQYTLRLDDAGESSWTYPNTVGSDGTLWRAAFDPGGHLMWLEVSLGGELDQVVCIDTVATSDGRGFASTLDATDFCSSLWGNGAGLQSGTTGQLQAVVYDPLTLLASLFDAQGWQDFSDASFVSLLQALLNAQLGLRLEPWQLLSADPSSSGEGSVVVHGQDGMFLLKKAYERDWTIVKAPRDVIERGTQVWVPLVADSFPADEVLPGQPGSPWSYTAGGGSMSLGPSGRLILSGSGTSATPTISQTKSLTTASSVWRAITTIAQVSLGGSSTLALRVNESSGDEYVLAVFYGTQMGFAFGNGLVALAPQGPYPLSTSYTLMIESDGEWVWAFINGQFVGYCRRLSASTTSLETTVAVDAVLGTATGTIQNVLAETLQPFLQRGTDKGDYALPGTASTYPSGGLSARYFNDLDLQSDSNRLSKILAPPRAQAFAGSGTAEYANQQDATIASQANPTPGAASSHWSCIWFGAIYLKLSTGDYTLRIGAASGFNSAVRVWIGETEFGTQLCDAWTWANGVAHTFTVSAASLGGALPYGGGSVQRDGWYPIKIEYAVDDTAGGAPLFVITSSPAAYTDPGGTAIASGAQTTTVPSTSLSPLGCVDQRYQGVSHFDLVQQTIQGYGYQASVEPQDLESGLFPGVLAPRVREGHDTDLVLAPDKTAREDWAGTLRPQLANTWPLPGSLAAMRWRPGDGIRVEDEEIGVLDATPRQILTFTRNLLPNGIASAVASLANRPRNTGRVLKQMLYSASRWQRNYQRQLVNLTGTRELATLAAGATDTNSSLIILAANDLIVRARLRVSSNSGTVPFGVAVNGSDVTSTFNGPWTTVPLNLDLGPVAVLGSDNRLVVQLKNEGGLSSTFDYQIFVDVLR